MKKYCVLNSLSPFKHTQVIIDFICFGFALWEGVINKKLDLLIQSGFSAHNTHPISDQYINLILMSPFILIYFVHLYYADHAKDSTFGLQSDIFCKTEGSVQGSVTFNTVSA